MIQGVSNFSVASSTDLEVNSQYLTLQVLFKKLEAFKIDQSKDEG